MRKEKGELRDLKSQLKYCVSHLKVSVCSLKEMLVSSSHGAEIAVNQIQPLPASAELQRKLDSQLHRVSAVEMRALTGREWDRSLHMGPYILELAMAIGILLMLGNFLTFISATKVSKDFLLTCRPRK